MRQVPTRGRRTESADDTLIKVAAGIIVLALLSGGVRWYRAVQAADALAIATTQAQQQAAASADAARRAVQRDQFAQWQAEHARAAQAGAQPTMYKCRDASGAVAIQNWPCNAGAQAEWSRPYDARDAREAADANQRAADIARHEAEVARYTQQFGDRPAPVIYSSGPQPSDNQARCAAAKRYRDDVYRQVGNNRNFNLIRQLNDAVYEACKGT